MPNRLWYAIATQSSPCAAALFFFVGGVQAQSLLPTYPSKEYVYFGSRMVAAENTRLPDVGNDGFEAGTLASWPNNWGGSNVTIAASIHHGGSYSLMMTGPNNTGIGQDIAGLIPNNQYVVSVWVNVSAGATALLYLDDTVSTTTTKIASQGQTNGWQLISLPFTVDSTGKIRIHLWFDGSGTIYWDDISLVPATALWNYSFETGTFAGWPYNWGGSNVNITPNAYHSGSYSLMMTGPDNTGIGQDIAGLIPNDQYVASVWVNVSAGATALLYLDNTVSTTTTKIASQGQTSGWQLISLPFTVDSTGKIRIHLWFDGSGTIYWDDVSLVPAIPLWNYSFETGTVAGWNIANGSNASIAASTAHSGSYALVESAPYNSGVYQDVSNVAPGQQYVVSAWVNVSAGATAGLYLDDTTNPATTAIATQNQTNGWQFISLPFTADSTGKIRVLVGIRKRHDLLGRCESNALRGAPSLSWSTPTYSHHLTWGN